MTTLKEVAKEAGVSVSTVSLVVNHKPYVKEDKRKRVLEILRRVNYVPNPTARALRKKGALLKTESIGVVIPGPLSSFSASSHVYRTIAGIEQEVKQIQHHLILGSITKDGSDMRLPRMLEERKVDGLIVISVGHLAMEQVIEEVMRYVMPVILTGYPGDRFKLPSVVIDNQKAAYEATSHLISAGFPRIATITGPLSYPTASERLEGYKLALLENELPVKSELVYEGDFSEEAGYQGMQVLLGKVRLPFGVFVAGDFMAKGALKFLAQKDIKVPEEVGMVGFDDVEYIVSSTVPTLSSVRAPWEEVGREAVRQLMLLNESRNMPAKIVLSCELKTRESSNCQSKEVRHEKDGEKSGR